MNGEAQQAAEGADQNEDLSLEEQLRALDETAPPGPVYTGTWADRLELEAPSPKRWDYVRKRTEIVGRLRRREAKRLSDPGPDEGGRLSPPPYVVQHGHIVEAAPQEQRISVTSSFPKRIATQRMIDRYKAQGLITVRQWKAADRVWRVWRDSGRDPNLIASYSPNTVQAANDPDRRMVGRGDAVSELDKIWALLGVLGFDLLTHVVIWDLPASDWASRKRTSARKKKAFGMDLLTNNLDVLARHFRY